MFEVQITKWVWLWFFASCGLYSYLKIKQRTALKKYIFITDGTGMTESFYYRLGHHSSNLNGEGVWI